MAIGEICSVCEAWVYDFEVDEDGSIICLACRDFDDDVWKDSQTEQEIDEWIERHNGGCRGK